MPTFSFTPKQQEALALIAEPAKNVMLYGGSRSGKTFTACAVLAARALKAPNSRHAAFRYRFNAIKAAVCLDTWPKMMGLVFPGVSAKINREDWYAQFPNGSQVWFGGLDEKDRVEKILGMEFSTIFFNECSQIPFASRETALTRLAQKVMVEVQGRAPQPLALKALYDENPPDKSHWTYRLFEQKVEPDTKKPLRNPDDYASLAMNPADNTDNLSAEYIATLQAMSARMRLRFLDGRFRDANPSALFPDENIERWRLTDTSDLPDMVRIVVGVDPSGSDDIDNADNDEIGVAVAGLGIDGKGYLLEDVSMKGGPAKWGDAVAQAFRRHGADIVVAEGNFGGAMVKHVIKTALPRATVKIVTASRGKHVRAEPISALVEKGEVRLAGYFSELEDELSGFTTNGYVGDRSPNRADAFVWAMTELFPGMVEPREDGDVASRFRPSGAMFG